MGQNQKKKADLEYRTAWEWAVINYAQDIEDAEIKAKAGKKGKGGK